MSGYRKYKGEEAKDLAEACERAVAWCVEHGETRMLETIEDRARRHSEAIRWKGREDSFREAATPLLELCMRPDGDWGRRRVLPAPVVIGAYRVTFEPTGYLHGSYYQIERLDPDDTGTVATFPIHDTLDAQAWRKSADEALRRARVCAAVLDAADMPPL